MLAAIAIGLFVAFVFIAGVSFFSGNDRNIITGRKNK